ncbi:replication endonuclease [Acidovorax delafieldii]|uniref:replication endonuclease n=1 Tax=Acidovorax delafieldii TaxID=47920 RepID=UPI003ED058DA
MNFARAFIPDPVWAAGRVAPLPTRWQGRLLDAWKGAHGKDRRGANVALREVTEKLLQVRIPLDASDAQLCDAAQALADRCASAAERIHEPFALLRHMEAIAEGQGIESPYRCGQPVGPAIARLTCHQWWRRKLRAHHGRAVEAAAIRLGYVRKGREIYCSTDTLQRRIQQNARNHASLENTTATNELGQEYTLAELAAKGPANKAIRRAELMTRIAGFERIARDMGHVGLFMTITCPSRMHRMRTVGPKGAKVVVDNPRWDGTLPRAAQAYLSKVWARIRAKLARLEIGLYGFRIAEPQQDGTPHWHFVVFHEADKVAQVRGAVLVHALRDSPDEPGAHAHRVDFKAIDWDRPDGSGSAAGYIAKYVAKNIDGYRLEADLHGNPALETSARVEAWASTWGIRQFQQVGGPPVGPWRELRRVEALPAGVPAHLVEAHNAVNKLAKFGGQDNAEAAGRVAWDHYVRAQGGVFCGRDYRVKVAQVEQDKLTRYGEQAGPRPIGVETTSVEEWIPESIKAMHPMDRYGFEPLRRTVHWLVESTRHEWVISGRARSNGRVSIGTAQPGPWTRVNNCTEGVSNGHGRTAAASGQVHAGLCGSAHAGAYAGEAIHGARVVPAGGAGGVPGAGETGAGTDHGGAGAGWLQGEELQRWREAHMCGPWVPVRGGGRRKSAHTGGRTGAALAAWLERTVHGPRLPND